MEMGKCLGIRHTVTAADVTAGSVGFNVDSAQATGALATVRTAAGVLKAWDGLITVTGDLVTVDNTGAVDWVASYTIYLVFISG